MTHPAGPRLWLVRHAQPCIASGTCYGSLDIAADATATHLAATQLAQVLPTGADVAHSPLQRCEQLVLDLLRHRPDLASKPDARLREMHFGTWEGQPWDAIGPTAIDAWAQQLAHHAPGGGEPLQHMLARVSAALADAQAVAHTATHTQGRDVVWVTHAGVARCVQWLQQHGTDRLPQAHEWPTAAPGYGQWVVFSLRAASV